ncbi:hypothetical protein BC827DRAFT_236161 [Russula dissimulans]|nr:hypothetical protein BC827DRAFT_236161 [Russula dissimulans]
MSRPVSPTLVNGPEHTERPSIKLKISGGRSNIDNSVIVDATGQALFSIKSNSRRTNLVSCRDNVEIAKIKWNRMSPCMVFRGKKMTCEEWLPLARPESESEYLHARPCYCACDDSELCPTLGLAYLHAAAMHNSRGWISRPRAMCVLSPFALVTIPLAEIVRPAITTS